MFLHGTEHYPYQHEYPSIFQLLGCIQTQGSKANNFDFSIVQKLIIEHSTVFFVFVFFMSLTLILGVQGSKFEKLILEHRTVLF